MWIVELRCGPPSMIAKARHTDIYQRKAFKEGLSTLFAKLCFGLSHFIFRFLGSSNNNWVACYSSRLTDSHPIFSELDTTAIMDRPSSPFYRQPLQIGFKLVSHSLR